MSWENPTKFAHPQEDKNSNVTECSRNFKIIEWAKILYFT